jgi:hypothetical protein
MARFSFVNRLSNLLNDHGHIDARFGRFGVAMDPINTPSAFELLAIGFKSGTVVLTEFVAFGV